MKIFGRSSYAIVTVAVAGIVFLAVNLTANEILSKHRFDLTERSLYSLSEGSKFVLQNLSEPIGLDLFVSKAKLIQLPALHAYASRVEDVLKTYARLANGMISYRVIEPEPFSSGEDLAIRNGLRGVPGDSGESLYFGLVGSNSVDDIEIIPLFFPEREELLEYELTQLIAKLNSKKQKMVGVISSLPIHSPPFGAANMGTSSWAIYQQLSNFFDVRLLDELQEEIPNDIDMLAVIHPVNYSESLLYEIDQFVLSGKAVLILVDPYSEVIATTRGATVPNETDTAKSDLNFLTQNWGVKLVHDKIIGDLPIAARVVDNSSSTPQVVDYPLWMNIQPDQMNAEDVVTSMIGNIFMGTTGVLELSSREGIDAVPLISTTEEAKLYGPEAVSDSTDLQSLLEDYQPLGRSLLIAVRIRGKANTAFPNRESDTNGEYGSGQAHLARGVVNAIVIADTDFLHDRFWVTAQEILGQVVVFPQASNGELVLNSINNLANNDALIGIPSRGGYLRPFLRIQEIRQAAEKRYREQEARLAQELEMIENTLVDLQANQSNAQAQRILTKEQRQNLRQIQTTRSEIRTKLREVRRNLDRDIQKLKQNVILINSLLSPLIVVFLGIAVAAFGAKYRGRKLLREVTAASKCQ